MGLLQRRFATIVICTLILILTSCQQNEPIEKAGKKVEIAAATLDDAAITAEIKAEILNDHLLKVSKVEVTTTKGVVTLSGTVNSQTSVDRAVEIARSIKGVKEIETGEIIKGY